MSHFTSIKTTLTKKSHLLAALQSLGYVPEEGGVSAHGFAGNKIQVEIRVPIGACFDVGFRKVGNAYELIADWMVAGINRITFLQQVTQRYAYYSTREKLEAQGFILAAEEAHQDGSIHLVLQRAG